MEKTHGFQVILEQLLSQESKEVKITRRYLSISMIITILQTIHATSKLTQDANTLMFMEDQKIFLYRDSHLTPRL